MVLDGRLDAREGLGGGGHATFPGTFGGRGGAGGEMEGGRGEMGGRGKGGKKMYQTEEIRFKFDGGIGWLA